MTCLAAFTVLVALVGLERLAELVVSKRNAAWSLEHGGVETGRGHYPVMVVLHTGLLVGALVEAWVRRPDVPPLLAWSMLVLVLGLAGAALVVHRHPRPALEHPRDRRARACRRCAAAPTGCCAHPNYVAVVVEGFALPLVHAAWVTALVFTRRERRAAHRADPGRGRAPCATLPGAARRCVTCWSPAAARSGWRPRCTPPAPASTSSVREPRAGADRQGLRRGADAGRGRRARRPRRRPRDGRPLAGIRYVDAGPARAAEAPFRHGPGRGVRRTTLHAALRPRSPRAGVAVEPRAVPGRSRTAATTCSSTASRCALPRRGRRPALAGRAGCSGWTRRVGGPRRFGLRTPRRRSRRGRSFVEVHWAPAGEAYVTPVGRRPGRRGGADRRAARRSTELLGGVPAAGARG